MRRRLFPENFYWGAGTAAHQVEGGLNNDWTEWEKSASRIKSLKSSIKSGEFRRTLPAHLWEKWPTPDDIENYISGRACDSYNRFREDFDIAKSLGHNAHRLSVEWSRIEPEEGKFDEKEIEHYREVIGALRERGIEPFVTLWWWPIPLWLRDKGGWESSKVVQYFSRYIEHTAGRLKDLVTFWITINEPEIYVSASYRHGFFPPHKKSFVSRLVVTVNLVAAHKQAYKAIHAIAPASQVGIANNTTYFEPGTEGFCSWNKFWNLWFLNQIRNNQDFIGLNYYFHKRIPRAKSEEDLELSDMGWEIYPPGIYHVLKDLAAYQKPIYITENGVADARDSVRGKYLKEHLYWVLRAIEEGVDVRGYLHWALLDNFEWDKGFWPRLGLVEMDYRTLERKIRSSALMYKKIAETNSLELP